MPVAALTAVEAALAANDAFYRAFESLDRSRMEAVWLPSDEILCVHPGAGVLVGWEAVMAGWDRIFAGTVSMRFTQRSVQVGVAADVAWVVLVEDIASVHPDGRGHGLVQATNLFRRVDDRWLMLHHHGSPLLEPTAGPSLH